MILGLVAMAGGQRQCAARGSARQGSLGSLRAELTRVRASVTAGHPPAP
jgi:hypothetical protein